MSRPRIVLIVAVFSALLFTFARNSGFVGAIEVGNEDLSGIAADDLPEAQLPPGWLTDPGLTEGESAAGCRYSAIEGLVYFCGNLKDSVTHGPVEGITVAVYEELPPSPSIVDPSALYSATGKYGGNLVHLFTSSWTNQNGHFEITGRQGKNVYVAFLCGENLLGGMKRLTELSRVESVDDLVDCPTGSRYVDPPKQLNYVDRKGFLECTANVYKSLLGTSAGSSVSPEDDPVNVGFSSTPVYLARSEIAIENYDYRFMPVEFAARSLNTASVYPNATTALSDRDILGPVEFEDKAAWLEGRDFGDGPWREDDCRETYKDIGGIDPCSIDDVNNIIKNNFEDAYSGYGDDVYTVLNHLRFIPPEHSLPAFARVDIRTSLRQFNQGNSAIARYMDAVFGNYVGEKLEVKEPGSDGLDGTITEAEYDEDQLISCSVLKESMNINNYSETGGPANNLRAPGELEQAAVEQLGLDQSEMQFPVCTDGGSEVTAYDVCFGDLKGQGMCRAEFLLPKGSGSAMMAYTAAEEEDSVAQGDDTLRGIEFDPASTAAEDAWKDQSNVILPAETNVHAARNPVSAAYITGSPDLGGVNYSAVLDSPASSAAMQSSPTGEEEEQKSYVDTGVPCQPQLPDQCSSYPGSFCSYVETVSGRDMYRCLYEETGEPFGFAESPTEASKYAKPSPNAMKEELVVQDVGSDSVAHCTISTIFDDDNTQDGGYENLVRGYLTITNPALAGAGYLTNFFTGNSQHAYQAVVGSGTFYTLESLKRDEYLSLPDGVPNEYDKFDGMRSIASGGTRINFGALTDGDIAAATRGAYGTASWLGPILDALGVGSERPATKSFGDRKTFDVANMTAMTVFYSLNERNFDSYFPIPESPYEPSSWGDHPNYKWQTVPEGNFCATAPDTPGGLSRTCKVARCGTVLADMVCNNSGCNATNIRWRDTDACSIERRSECAVDQQSTELKFPNNLERRYVTECAVNPGSCVHEDEEFRNVCGMERAGPYTSPAPLNWNIANRITQENKYQGGGQVGIDTTIPAVENLAKAFQSPTETFVSTRQGAELDVSHSAGFDVDDADTPYDEAGVTTQGYPVEGVGGVPQNIYSVASPPNSSGRAGIDNTIYYHCNNLGVSVDGVVKGGDWNCPVAPVATCSGLFGQVQGIDRIPISPAGQTSIAATFDITKFQESLPIYAQIEEETGVPCEVMAGIHYREAGNNPSGSFEDGGSLRNGSLLEDGLIKAKDLLSDIGASPQPGGLALTTIEQIARALLAHNGWGNNNCSAPAGTTNYNHCPAVFPGDDNNYIMAYADSNHDGMAIIYPADGTPANVFCSTTCSSNPSNYATACGLCPPPIEEQRVGALVIAKYLYDLGATSLVD